MNRLRFGDQDDGQERAALRGEEMADGMGGVSSFGFAWVGFWAEEWG